MKAAFYESDITPPLGCYMTGYGCDRRAMDVFDRLYSKALVIEDDGKYVVIISVDICEYPKEMPSVVGQRIKEYTGIEPDSICIHSTHTHRGAPVTDDANIGCYADNPYKDVFFRLVADSAILAFKHLQDVTFKYANVSVSGIAQSRCSVMKDGSLKSFATDSSLIERPFSNPDGYLPALFVETDGKAIGVLYTFGCHQDTVKTNGFDGYSGDYSSVVSEFLKENYGNDFVSIYMAAPSGDVNTYNPYAKEDENSSYSHDVIGKILAHAIIDMEKNAFVIDGKLISVKEKVKIRKRKYTNDEYFDLIKKYANERKSFQLTNLVYYQKTDKEAYTDLYVQIIKIGDFALFVYPGEMFCEYANRTRKYSPCKYNMIAENCNCYGGYIPTPQAFVPESNLYEISPAYDSFCMPDTGDILYDKLMDMINKI